jgi:hypothetical protein
VFQTLARPGLSAEPGELLVNEFLLPGPVIYAGLAGDFQILPRQTVQK